MSGFTTAVALLSLALSFQETVPIPTLAAGSADEQRSPRADRLLACAKKVVLIGTVGHVAATGLAMNPTAKKAQELLEKEVQKWGRFTIIADPAEADIVLILAEGNRAAGGGGTIRTARLEVFPGGPTPKRGEIPLWDEQANGTIFATSGAPKVISQFRKYLEELDKKIPAVTTKPFTTSVSTVPANSASLAPEVKSSPPATSSPTAARHDAITPRPAKYVPPLEVISKAKTFSLRGKGTAGDQGKLERFMGIGKYGNVHSAMEEVFLQLRGSGRMEYEEDLSKADIVVLVFQWDTRTYSRDFHGVRTAIQIAEGGDAFQREDSSLWISGTVEGSAKELVDNLWFDLARFEHSQPPQPTHAANKNYDRGCDMFDSAEKKSGHSQRDLLFESIAEFRRSVRTNPDYAPAHERLGTTLLKLGYNSAAAYEFKQALLLQPNSHDTLISLAKAMGGVPDFTEAEQAVRDALRIFPDNVKDHLLLGDFLYRDRDYPAAIGEYSKAVRIEPRDSVSHLKLGRAYYRSKQLDKAEMELREAIGIKPDDETSLLWLGSTLNEMRRSEDAINVLRTAEKLNPKDASVHFELERAFRASKKYDAAIGEIKQALEFVPTSATYHFELARLLADAGRTDEALTKYREIVRNLPNSPAGRDELGRILLMKAQIDDAIAEFEQATKLDSKFAVAYFDLGRALEAKGDTTHASEAFRQAHDLEPENDEFKASLQK